MNPTISRSTWSFFGKTQFTFGPRATTHLAALVHRQRTKRVFLITDSVLAGLGVPDLIQQMLEPTDAKLTICADGQVEPTAELAQQVADQAAAVEPDMFVALGGGSVMDLAKSVRAMVRHGCSAESMWGFDQVPGPSGCLVCLPTTAGSGSEVSHVAVIKDSDSGQKIAAASQWHRADVAIVDPYMTVTCPTSVTAASGMDALTHAIEAYLATNFFQLDEDLNRGLPFEGNNPMADMFAEKAMALVGANLARAIEQPEHLAARSSMALAASLAGFAFSCGGVGLAHALEGPVSLAAGCSHGTGNAMLLPQVMRYLLPHREKRLAQVGRLLDPQLVAAGDTDAAQGAIERVIQLRDQVGLPGRLSELGVTAEQIPGLAKEGMKLTPLVRLTPGDPQIGDAQAILNAIL